MRLRKFKRLLQAETRTQGEPDEPTEAQEAVEQSRLALEEIRSQAPKVQEILDRNSSIRGKNGFGQLSDKLFERERERRRHLHGGMV
jgi:hypothetical protein